MLKEKIKVSASLWSADLKNLGTSLQSVEKYCDAYHFDIMDGHYVPYLLFGSDIVAALRPLTSKPFDIHLMVNNPDELVDAFIEAGGDIFILHAETCNDICKTARYLKTKGKKVGLALKVNESCEDVLKYISEIDYIVVMGTEIGIKGVSLHPQTYERIQYLKDQIQKLKPDVKIQVDGGIRRETVPKLYESGADFVTAGSLLFNDNYFVE
jgi:ribulose-phosphate 3-epimerase